MKTSKMKTSHQWTSMLTAIVLVKILFLVSQPNFVESKGQYVMPLLGGMKMSLPYDLANIFIRPIAGSVSTFLSISLLFVLFFGVITAPFGYMFGIPSRKYVLGSPPDILHSQTAPRSLPMDFESFNFSSIFQDDSIPLSFEEQVFYLLSPDIQTEECKLLALCHAHNAVKKLPQTILKIIRLVSEKLIELSPAHKEAIKLGLRNQENCDVVYDNCKESGYTILIKTILYLLPESMKNHSHRRKKGMYM